MNIFRYDSPLMQFLTRAADLVWLNILVLLCSVPVFTAGAAISAMESIIYKLLHNEDVMVTKEFFIAFGKNFKQATVIWLILLVIEGALGYDFYYSRQIGTGFSEAMKTCAVVLFVLVFALMLYIFPLQAHYINKTKDIFKNAAIPIIHGIPGSLLGALTGAFITERVYVVPGIGGLLINAIGAYDNGVIVGVTLFYGVLSVVSMILGDVLMAMVDPRINFTSKAR